MRFLVPQFIDVEDKIFGPLTLKQAIYLAGGGGVVVALFVQFGFMWAFLLGSPVAALAFTLAFVKINNRPFYFMVYSFFFYLIGNKLYLWKRMPNKVVKKKVEQQFTAPVEEKITQKNIKALARSLDSSETMYTTKHR